MGIGRIASDIYNYYHGISRDFLGIPISTEQIFDIKEFISVYDSNEMAAPLSTTFQFREKEIVEVLSKIEKSNVIIISGSAGVGKTRLALECCQRYASKNRYRLYCIQSNHLPIYKDLKVFLDTPGKYLLMIDDANQITGLQHILQYLTKQRQGYDIKIVITVRDYAKQKIIYDVREFVIPEIIPIDVFNDDQIKELLRVNFEIFNSKYLDKIVKIAEGNARLAIIAGKLAVETQSLDSINDASQLYEGYYGKFLKDSILNQDQKLCATAGIIAFLSAINLEHLETLIPILEMLEISDKLFIDHVYKLHELEMVDIYNDRAVKISDQCFGNYLLKHVFITKKIIPLFSIYFSLMFNPYISKPETLVERFKDDWGLLKEIYFKLISYEKNTDHNGVFLITFAKFYPSFIDEYIEFTVIKERASWIHGGEERLSAIWDCENYICLADQIIEKYSNYSESDLWQISDYIENILKCHDKSGVRTRRQDNWTSHFIDVNYGNARLMQILFSAITELSPERRKTHILHLIRLNSDPDLFINLEIKPNSWGGTGSMIPYMEERIDFLKSLLPELSGLKYLKHKQRIEKEIAKWQQRIEHEQIYEVLEGR